MSLSPKQLAMYRAEWGKVRKMLRRLGVSPREADAARMDIHRRMGVTHKDGTPKSSTELTNADLTRVLAGFWSITCLPESRVAARLRQTHAHQAAIMGRWSCEHIFSLIRELAPDEVSEDGLGAYLDGMFYNLNGGRHLGGLNPATGNADQWHKVMLAACYRYDQIVRRLLGEQGNRYGVRYWPHAHRRNLAELEAEGAIHQREDAQFAPAEVDKDVPF